MLCMLATIQPRRSAFAGMYDHRTDSKILALRFSDGTAPVADWHTWSPPMRISGP
jgi:hypothetical protein|eukprot:SAG25_NODE_379_length_8822_cov_7.896366_11_plen_55_part_00